MFLVRLSRAESVKKTQGVMRFSIRPKSKLWGVNSGYRRDPSSACMLDGLRGPHPTGRSVKVTGSLESLDACMLRASGEQLPRPLHNLHATITRR